jgi:hypothetical protein
MTSRLRIAAIFLLALPAFCAAEDARLSTFDRSRVQRDPFAAIDPKQAAPAPEAVVAADSRADAGLETLCRVSAVSIDRLGIAVINGRAIAEGEKFFVKAKDRKIPVTLRKVTQEGAELDFGGTVITVRIVRGMQD